MPDRLTRLANVGINRVALVPKGDNPEAHLTLWKSATPEHADVTKRTFTADERKQAIKDGASMPDGAYPIYNASDLSNAVQAVGRGNAPTSAVKAHIIKRAKALGLTDKLPEGWMGKEDVTKEPRLTQTRRTALEAARDAINGVLRRKEDEEMPEDTEKQYELPENADDELREFVEKLQKERDEAIAKAGTEKDEPETAEDISTVLEKADPAIRELVEKAQADAAEAKAQAEVLTKAAQRADAMEKAATLKHLGKADEIADEIQQLRVVAPDLAPAIETRLERAESLASEAFIEIGKDGGDDVGDAMHKLDALVAKTADADGITKAQALVKVIETPEGKALHREANEEANAR